MITAIIAASLASQRKTKWMHNRINWPGHMDQCHHEIRGFQTCYHTSKLSLNKLISMLKPLISHNELQSIRSSRGNKPITHEMIFGCGLRFLGSEYIKSIVDMYGISPSSVHRCINRFLVAANNCKELEINLPSTEEELQQGAMEWNKLSGVS